MQGGGGNKTGKAEWVRLQKVVAIGPGSGNCPLQAPEIKERIAREKDVGKIGLAVAHTTNR